MPTAEVAVGFHGDDGACATQFVVVVLDLDDALLEVQEFLECHAAL